MSMRATVKSVLGEKNVRVLRRLKRRLSARPAGPAKPTGLDAISGDLNKLAQHFKTDKWGVHRYTQHYQRHLGHLRNDSFNLLEIVNVEAIRDWRHAQNRPKD